MIDLEVNSVMFFVRRFWAKQFCSGFSFFHCLLFGTKRSTFLEPTWSAADLQQQQLLNPTLLESIRWWNGRWWVLPTFLTYSIHQEKHRVIERPKQHGTSPPGVHPESTASTSCAEPQKESDCPRNPHHIHRGSMSPWVSTIPCWPSTRQSSHGHLNLAHWHSGLEQLTHLQHPNHLQTPNLLCRILLRKKVWKCHQIRGSHNHIMLFLTKQCSKWP